MLDFVGQYWWAFVATVVVSAPACMYLTILLGIHAYFDDRPLWLCIAVLASASVAFVSGLSLVLLVLRVFVRWLIA